MTVPQQVPASTTGKDALTVAADAARSAGKVLVDRFHTRLDIRSKGRGNVVTDADLAAEKAILDVLAREYPDFGTISEESDPVSTGSPFIWVIDPLDGTRNYASGVPHFCVVVALTRGGRTVLGVTHDPVRDEMFTAETGKGAFLNGAPISVSSKGELVQCLLAFDLGYVDESAGRALDMMRTLWPGMEGMRLMGSGALGLAYAACGRVDIYFHHRLYPWDIVSGLLLVREAGGVVVDRNGSPATLESPSVIASSTGLVEGFLAVTDGLPWRQG